MANLTLQVYRSNQLTMNNHAVREPWAEHDSWDRTWFFVCWNRACNTRLLYSS